MNMNDRLALCNTTVLQLLPADFFWIHIESLTTVSNDWRIWLNFSFNTKKN